MRKSFLFSFWSLYLIGSTAMVLSHPSVLSIVSLLFIFVMCIVTIGELKDDDEPVLSHVVNMSNTLINPDKRGFEIKEIEDDDIAALILLDLFGDDEGDEYTAFSLN